jgi:hypothetical protein
MPNRRRKDEPSYLCGECEEVIQPERAMPNLQEFVVRCGCGAYNQA